MPGARAALLLLVQRQKFEAGEERRNAGQVAIVVWVRLGVAAADEGVGGDRPAGHNSHIFRLRCPAALEQTGIHPILVPVQFPTPSLGGISL